MGGLATRSIQRTSDDLKDIPGQVFGLDDAFQLGPHQSPTRCVKTFPLIEGADQPSGELRVVLLGLQNNITQEAIPLPILIVKVELIPRERANQRAQAIRILQIEREMVSKGEAACTENHLSITNASSCHRA